MMWLKKILTINKKRSTLSQSDAEELAQVLLHQTTKLRDVNKLLLSQVNWSATPYEVEEKKRVIEVLAYAWINSDIRCGLLQASQIKELTMFKMFIALAVMSTVAIFSFIVVKGNDHVALAASVVASCSLSLIFIWRYVRLLSESFAAESAEFELRWCGIKVAVEAASEFEPKSSVWPAGITPTPLFIWRPSVQSASRIYQNALLRDFEVTYLREYLLHSWVNRHLSFAEYVRLMRAFDLPEDQNFSFPVLALENIK